jgi:hypothetical protein
VEGFAQIKRRLLAALRDDVFEWVAGTTDSLLWVRVRVRVWFRVRGGFGVGVRVRVGSGPVLSLLHPKHNYHIPLPSY